MRILVTGASGFMGRRICTVLTERGHSVRAAGRIPFGSVAEFHKVPEIRGFDWSHLLEDVDCVVHLAAIAHTRNVDVANLASVNRDAAIAIAHQLGPSQHFIFMSSIRAKGSDVELGQWLSEEGSDRPSCYYGQMKLAAENQILSLHPDACLLRPVTVYGTGVKSGMRRLEHLMRSALPLPFRGLSALRSYLSLDNLADAVAFSAERRLAGVHNLADPEPVSLQEFVVCYRSARGSASSLFYVPRTLLVAGAQIAGLQDLAKLAASPLTVRAQKILDAGLSLTHPSTQAGIKAWAEA